MFSSCNDCIILTLCVTPLATVTGGCGDNIERKGTGCLVLKMRNFSRYLRKVRSSGNIKDHSVLSECQVTPNTVNWTVSGSCRVQQAFSSDNIYTCSWTRSNDNQQTFGSFDARRELCSFTQKMPQDDGLYSYSIYVLPPSTTILSKEVKIASPGNLSIFCPRAVPEGSSFVVSCETETAGSPPAIVHLEGEQDKQKVISSVPRTANGMQFRCHMTWGGSTKSTSIYTLLVAYGPETVSIVDSSPSNSTYATLFCSASDAYPGVVYSWKGACVDVNNTKDGSTCLLSQPISDSDVITCTAVNSLFDISATASYGLGTQPPIAAAVGGAAAGVIVLTAISVVAVYLKKRKDGTYARTTGGREEPHPYMDLEIRGEGEGHCDTALPSSS